MSNPGVSIDLSLSAQDFSAAIADIGSSIKAGLGKLTLGNLGDQFNKFKNWEGTVGDALDGMRNKFARLKFGIKTTVSGSIVLLGALPDYLDSKIRDSIDKTIDTFYKLKTASRLSLIHI